MLKNINGSIRKRKIYLSLLGAYELFLSFGAILTGSMMVAGNQGVFAEYPRDWLMKLPFDSWVVPGVISIVVFGLGNIVAAVLCFYDTNKAWLVSIVMGTILCVSAVLQVMVLGEWYLATLQLFILGMVQLWLSGRVNKK